MLFNFCLHIKFLITNLISLHHSEELQDDLGLSTGQIRTLQIIPSIKILHKVNIKKLYNYHSNYICTVQIILCLMILNKYTRCS